MAPARETTANSQSTAQRLPEAAVPAGQVLEQGPRRTRAAAAAGCSDAGNGAALDVHMKQGRKRERSPGAEEARADPKGALPGLLTVVRERQRHYSALGSRTPGKEPWTLTLPQMDGNPAAQDKSVSTPLTRKGAPAPLVITGDETVASLYCVRTPESRAPCAAVDAAEGEQQVQWWDPRDASKVRETGCTVLKCRL
jgi:hypothetical protein